MPRVYHPGDDNYVEADHSQHFLLVPMAGVQAFLLRRGQTDETSLVKLFRHWVHDHVARGWPKP